MRLEWLDPRSLTPHSENYRLHPTNQRRALERGLKTLGWLTPLVLNRRTGRLLDGHLRREEAIERGLEAVPVVVVDIPEEREHAALGIIDTVSGMALEDDELKSVIARSTAQVDEALAQMLYSLTEMEEEVPEEEKSDEDKFGVALVPGEEYNYVVLLFRSSLDWIAAQDHFQLAKVRDPLSPEEKRVGLGRVIDGGAYLTRVRSGE